MILKFLLVVAVIAVVYFFFIKKKPTKEIKHKNKEKLQSSDMVECGTCGIYAEVSDSILSGAKYYCSKECMDKS